MVIDLLFEKHGDRMSLSPGGGGVERDRPPLPTIPEDAQKPRKHPQR